MVSLYIMNIIGSKKALAKFRTDEIRKARDEMSTDASQANDSPERKEISRERNFGRMKSGKRILARLK